MTQRYTNSVAAVMTSEPDASSPYGTRNKRRKLNEVVTPQTIPRHQQSLTTTPSQQRSTRTVGLQQSGRSPMFSRNLDKALKSILSENPKLRNSRGGGDTAATIDVTPSVDDDTGSTGVPVPENGRTSSISISSQSRENTPSSCTEGIVDIPVFITLFEKERETGKVTAQMRDEAKELLQKWRMEWQAEDKRVRELKRKIKSFNAANAVELPRISVERKSRGRSTVSRAQATINDRGIETPKQTASGEYDPRTRSDSRSRSLGRRDSLTGTGPNGLTGSYWDIPIEMGRGSRRKSKV